VLEIDKLLSLVAPLPELSVTSLDLGVSQPSVSIVRDKCVWEFEERFDARESRETVMSEGERWREEELRGRMLVRGARARLGSWEAGRL
jgi:hypothetical protein